jgi:hypothetical protein
MSHHRIHPIFGVSGLLGLAMAGVPSSARGQDAAVDFAISFEDVSVFQRVEGERVKVISNATGCVHSGDVLALVGPSSQTSLLLDTLRGVHGSDNGRDGISFHGMLSWNGQSPEEVDPRALAYVDVKEMGALLPEDLTCWEVLFFIIKVRVGFLSSGEQCAMVDQVPDPDPDPEPDHDHDHDHDGQPGAGHALPHGSCGRASSRPAGPAEALPLCGTRDRWVCWDHLSARAHRRSWRSLRKAAVVYSQRTLDDVWLRRGSHAVITSVANRVRNP